MKELYFTSINCLLVLLGLTSFVSLPTSAAEFSRDIRPILSDRCFTCHGPDEEAREADLRLDVREGAIESVIVPGDAEGSELVRRISSGDPYEQMPPEDSHRPLLNAEQITLIRRWIDEGAQYDKHWSFRLPERVAPPEIAGDGDGNAIDQFILAKLRDEKIEPAPPADRRTLIRRLSFDLTGLPPTPAEVAEFVDDPSDDAYEKLVDRLLSSKHFGERMAMYWLDVVRYADTNGIHGDNFRPHSSYRDWVIKAFNENLPYDQFVIDQLAGDLLPDSDYEQKIASGFNRLNMTTQEGGAQPKEYQAIYQADRVRNSSEIFLGLTLGCAQCHDHKFDPLTSRDFYSWGAFFADLEETPVGQQQPTTMRPVRHNPQYTALDNRIESLQRVVSTPTPQLEAAQVKWEKNLKKLPTPWTKLEPVSLASQAGAQLDSQDNNTFLVSQSKTPDKDEYTIEMKSDLTSVTALYLEAMADESAPGGGPGRAANGNFVLNELEVFIDDKPVKLKKATATFSQDGYSIESAIDGDPGTGWAILPKVHETHRAVFELEDVPTGEGARRIRIVMNQDFGGAHVIGRFRWWVTDAKTSIDVNASLKLESIARILKIEPAERTPEQRTEISQYYRSISPLLSEERAQLAELLEEQKSIGGSRPILISSSMEKPRKVRILPRGNWMDESGELVQPNIPAVFGSVEVENRRANRLDLAHWIVSAENPLAARVQVNRLWKIAFGQGLVNPLNDFGAQGNIPLHPQLLDWLATEFVEGGWNTKQMLKLMITSDAYRRTSITSADERRRDPKNEWYACQNRFRLDAEMVRDNALAISGLLNPTLGGKSVKPYQPAGYWDHLNFPTRVYEPETDANQFRRGLYTYWCRTFLHPSLVAFDAPSREECTAERPRSNTPLAALVLLNDPTYVEAARVFADRILKEAEPTTTGRIEFAYEWALQRSPRPEEIELLSTLFEQQLKKYTSDTEAAKKLQSVGLAPQHEGDIAERAAWIAVTRTILNLHETITRN